jgi:cystathionine beta-synthase
MAERGFLDSSEPCAAAHNWWWTQTVGRLPLNAPLTVSTDVLCNAAIDIMHREAYDQLPVVDAKGCECILHIHILIHYTERRWA